jgi:hypothetical protein
MERRKQSKKEARYAVRKCFNLVSTGFLIVCVAEANTHTSVFFFFFGELSAKSIAKNRSSCGVLVSRPLYNIGDGAHLRFTVHIPSAREKRPQKPKYEQQCRNASCERRKQSNGLLF